MDLKIIQSLLERVQTCKRCWKTKEFAGPGGFFPEDHWSWDSRTSITKQKQSWIIQVKTQFEESSAC